MPTSVDTLHACAERQKQLFYEHFLGRNRIGEILCVQNGQEDTVLFERWEIHGKGFVSTTVLLCEDTLILDGTNVRYRPIMEFVRDRERVNKERFDKLDEILANDGMTREEAKQKALESGQNPSHFDYSEVTRQSIEDRLPPGKKTIQGDRRTEIMVLERQTEVPNDLQQSRLNVYRVLIPQFIHELIETKGDEQIEKWFEENTIRPDESTKIATTLPFVRHIHYVCPTIYEWPDKEVDIEKEAGLK
jgi:hypothetical protein